MLVNGKSVCLHLANESENRNKMVLEINVKMFVGNKFLFDVILHTLTYSITTSADLPASKNSRTRFLSLSGAIWVDAGAIDNLLFSTNSNF